MMNYHQAEQPGTERPRLFYGYIIVAISLLIMLLGYGTRSSFGVFFKPMITDFGWSRALTSGAVTLSMITQGLWGIFMGRLNDRFGPRLIITLCCFLTGLGFLLMSTISSAWQIYMYYGVILGFGMGGVFVALLSTVSRWFVKRRGTMTGIVLTGIGLSTLAVSPVANWLISAYGWRPAYAITGGTVIVVGILLAQFLRRDPSKAGLQPYGYKETDEHLSSVNSQGFSLAEAVRTWQFWTTIPIFMCYGYCLFSVIVHLVPFITDTGVSATTAANILALCGATQVIGGLVMGNGIDKIGNRRVLGLCFILIAASVFLLIPFTDLGVIYLVALIAGFGIGGGGVTEPTLIAELFGMKSHGLILGIISFSFTIGGAIGPLVTGYIYDISGSYDRAFLVCVILSIVGLILTAILRPGKKPDIPAY